MMLEAVAGHKLKASVEAVQQFAMDLLKEIIVDLFAGGGGVSTGIEMALGVPPHVAVNHNDNALSMHRANHPYTRHFIADVFEIDPRGIVEFFGKAVGALHASPDCTHHSQAAGGQARDEKIRALAWVVVRWAGQVRPRFISMENVKQLMLWGRLIAKRDKPTGRVVTLDMVRCPKTGKMVNRIADPGERVPRNNQYLVPDPKHAGKTWNRFVRTLKEMGYQVESKVICAADHGAPTTRERLIMLARRDGQQIVWPMATHARVPGPGQEKWRSAAECIDWSIPCPSIFARKKPLADATMRRIAKGIERYVLKNPKPFIVPIAHYNGSTTAQSSDEPLRTITAATKGGEFSVVSPLVVPATHQGSDRVYSGVDPAPTVTAAHRGELMVASPVMIHAGHGEGAGESRRRSHGIKDAQEPLGTVVASGGGHAIAAANLIQVGYGERDGQAPRALNLEAPLGTIVGTGKHAVSTATLVPAVYEEPVLNVHCNNCGEDYRDPAAVGASGVPSKKCPRCAEATNLAKRSADQRLMTPYLMQANGGYNTTPGHDAREPVSSITGSGSQQQVVTAFLSRQFGNSVGQQVDSPAPTTTAGGGGKTSVVTAHLAHLRGNCDARDADDPLMTVSAGGMHHGVVSAFLSSYYTDDSDRCRDMRDPAATVTTENRLGLVELKLSPEEEAGALRVAAFLMEYYSEGGQWSDLNDPSNTITTRDRLALVTVYIQGDPYVIVDIGLRMLQPRELYLAQSFPASYIIEYGHDGRRFTKSDQVKMCGNSVPPTMIAAIYAANLPELVVERKAA